MAIVTKIELIKDTDKAKLYIDGEFYSKISYEVISKLRIYTGDDVDEVKLLELCEENGRSQAFDYLLNYVTKYQATEKRIIEKLKDREYSSATIKFVVEKAKEYGYINDYRFAQNYVESVAHKCGKYKIKNELYEKGVPNDIIKRVIDERDWSDIEENAIELAGKWAKYKNINDDKNKEKLSRYLSYRGYDWNIIKKCISFLENECIEDNGDE